MTLNGIMTLILHYFTGDADDRVRFRVCVQVYKCLHNMALEYLSTLCQPVSSVPDRVHLRSARRGELDFPRVNLATYMGKGRLPTPVPHIPDSLKNINLTLQIFKRHLKTFLFSTYYIHSARLRFLTKMRYIIPLLLLGRIAVLRNLHRCGLLSPTE